MISKNIPATIKYPAAGLSRAAPIHQAKPKKTKRKKNNPINKALNKTVTADAAFEAPCVTFALVSCI